MQRILSTIVCCLLFSVGQCKIKVVEMSYGYGPDTVFRARDTPLNLTTVIATYNKQYSYWLNKKEMCTSEHGGTHLDAPAHFIKGKEFVAQFPIEKLIGPGVVIDVSSKVKNDFDYLATKEDIQAWETANGKIPDGAIVILNTGWGLRYPDKYRVFNTTNPNDASTFHFPSWSGPAVDWLVNNRKINVLGVDTPSVDYGQSKDFPVHQLALNRSIPCLEQAANVDKLPVKGSTVYVAVMRLVEGTGAPARVFATYDDTPGAGARPMLSWILFVCIIVLFAIM